MFVSLCQWLKFCAFYVIVNFALDLLNIERRGKKKHAERRVEGKKTHIFSVPVLHSGVVTPSGYWLVPKYH